jgi:AcrR family transcriptional regulator
VFREKGFDSATVSEIVAEAGLAKGTFYYYYPSKIAIATALRDGLMNRMANAVSGSIGPHYSFAENLVTLVSVSFRMARQNADLMKLAFVGADETHPELHSESEEHAAFLNAVNHLLHQANERGEMRTMDLAVTARLITGLLQQAVIEAFVTGDGEESDELENGVTTLIINALVQTN